jgi:hypothetical protein
MGMGMTERARGGGSAGEYEFGCRLEPDLVGCLPFLDPGRDASGILICRRFVTYIRNTVMIH